MERSGIVACKGNSLTDTLIDNFVAHFGQPIHICLTSPVVAPFDRIIEEPIDTVAVILIVLGCIYPALSGNGMRPAGAILIAEILHLKTQLSQRGRCRSTSQPGAYHDDVKLTLVGWINQVLGRFVG